MAIVKAWDLRLACFLLLKASGLRYPNSKSERGVTPNGVEIASNGISRENLKCLELQEVLQLPLRVQA